jgi:hypothetical protein
MGLPTILLSNKSAATHGTVGLLGAGGALDQIGYRHLRVREDFDSPALAGKILPFVRAASAVRRLRGSVFGLFGGNSGDSIANAQSVTSIISDNGFADAASVGGMASAIASQSATGISGFEITTSDNLLLDSKNTVHSTASSSVVDA